jgi:hypothetical protein
MLLYDVREEKSPHDNRFCQDVVAWINWRV